MIDDAKCILETDYKDFFPKIKQDTVHLLSGSSATDLWDKEVSLGSSSYFDLPDESWIISSKSNLVGSWIDAYNNDDNFFVEKLLRHSVDWSDNEFIKFFVNKNLVLRASWKDFLLFWDGFIAIEDDCPLVIPENRLHQEAILFRPIGDFFKIG